MELIAILFVAVSLGFALVLASIATVFSIATIYHQWKNKI